jgi:hypothetical protein
VHLLNAPYEWGCTALAAPAPGGASARLLRQTGPAGDFAHLSWPGAVGVLTALAPGRFAAAINQPPIRRRAPLDWATLDAGFAAYDAWRSSGRWPAFHLLRHVFETAPDFAAARHALETTPIAAPAIFTLVGLRPDETRVIERDVAAHVTRMGVASAANAWRYADFAGDWRRPRLRAGARQRRALGRHRGLGGARGRSFRLAGRSDPERHDAARGGGRSRRWRAARAGL